MRSNRDGKLSSIICDVGKLLVAVIESNTIARNQMQFKSTNSDLSMIIDRFCLGNDFNEFNDATQVDLIN